MRTPAWFLAPLLLASSLATPGCVVRYSSTDPSSESAVSRDLAGAEGRALLLGRATPDASQKQRIEAARQLMIAARTWPLDQRSEVVDFVNDLLDIEEQVMPTSAVLIPQGSGGGVDEVAVDPGAGDGAVAVPVQEVPLGGGASTEEQVGTTEGPVALPPQGPSAEELATLRADALQMARVALAENRPRDAILALDGLGDLAVVEGAPALHKEAVDAVVSEERERAAQAFLTARGIPDPAARREALEQVRSQLQALLSAYPQNSYQEAIQRNLARVDEELSKGGTP